MSDQRHPLEVFLDRWCELVMELQDAGYSDRRDIELNKRAREWQDRGQIDLETYPRGRVAEWVEALDTSSFDAVFLAAVNSVAEEWRPTICPPLAEAKRSFDDLHEKLGGAAHYFGWGLEMIDEAWHETMRFWDIASLAMRADPSNAVLVNPVDEIEEAWHTTSGGEQRLRLIWRGKEYGFGEKASSVVIAMRRIGRPAKNKEIVRAANLEAANVGQILSKHPALADGLISKDEHKCYKLFSYKWRTPNSS